MNSPVRYDTKFNLLFASFFIITLCFLLPSYAVAATHEVMVLDPRSFSPNDLTIEVGDTVRWVNADGGNQHDVTADDSSFNSDTAAGFTFEKTFNSIAEILYHCTVHSSPASSGGTAMNGRINVVAAQVSTDVSVESVNAVDGAYEAGEEFRVEAALKNTGGGDSGMFNVNVYASTDSDITIGDTLLGTISISNIAAGESEFIDESVDLPASLAVGDYLIGVIIDLDDNDATNNSNVDEVPIFVFTLFTMNAGLNDAWFNRDTNGQGFFITIFPKLGLASLAWFTYDTELPPLDATANLGDPGHRWITGAGLFIDNQAVMDIVITSGGIFDAASDVQRTDPRGSDGTLTLTFRNCNSGTIEYDITSIDRQGTVPIERVANDNAKLCNALLRESQLPPP
jgi:plastocyanin